MRHGVSGGHVAVASAWDDAANGDVTTPAEPLPDDVETLKAMFLAQREALASAEARAMAAETNARDQALLIEKLEFGGTGPPAAVYFYSPDRRGEHPETHLAGWAGLMQADAYAGYDRLYEAGRRPGPIVEAACSAPARRKVFDLARLNKAPIALDAVARLDA